MEGGRQIRAELLQPGASEASVERGFSIEASCGQDGPKLLRAIKKQQLNGLKQQLNGLKQQLNGFQATADGDSVLGQPCSGAPLPVHPCSALPEPRTSYLMLCPAVQSLIENIEMF